MRSVDESEFAEYVAGHLGGLRRTAFLLCGDWHRAEDIVQTALTKVFLAWRRVRERGALDAYVRKALVRTYIDENRRHWRRETPLGDLPEGPAGDDFPEDRLVLLRALAAVPTRQRAALVLRYWEDLSVDEAAQALCCSSGTIKSSSARGLDSLRAELHRQGFAAPARLIPALPKES